MSDRSLKPDLSGRKVLVGRARPGRSIIASCLRTLGAEVVESPDIQVQPLADLTHLDEAFRQSKNYQAVIFACAESVQVVLPRMHMLGYAAHPVSIAVGEPATRALQCLKVEPNISTKGACRDELRMHFAALAGATVLCFCSANGRPQLCEDLLALNIRVHCVAAYKYQSAVSRDLPLNLDLVVLPSSSAASLLLKSDWAPTLRLLPIVAMGPSSASSARRLGADNVIEAEFDTVDSIVACAVEELIYRKGHTQANKVQGPINGASSPEEIYEQL